MKSWVAWALLALVTWGFWGLFPKLAVKYISPTSALFYEAVGAGVCGAVLALCFGGKPELNFHGALFGVLTGVTVVVGGWFYLFAAKEANTSSVVVLTAMYPIVTIALAALILKEQITGRQIVAMLLALCAVALLVTEQNDAGDSETRTSVGS